MFLPHKTQFSQKKRTYSLYFYPETDKQRFDTVFRPYYHTGVQDKVISFFILFFYELIRLLHFSSKMKVWKWLFRPAHQAGG